jgi:hypothetical protein
MREKIEEFRIEFVGWIRGFDKSYDIPDNWAIRFDASTPEQEELEKLMFDDDKLMRMISIMMISIMITFSPMMRIDVRMCRYADVQIII